jgi:hypothetical protein
VSGTTIGQWARREYIRSSQREHEPRVYAVEDVLEAAIVQALLERGARRADIRGVAKGLRSTGSPWPLTGVRLATTGRGRHARLLIDDGSGWHEIGRRGWQQVVPAAPVDEVRARLAPAA